jgi:uncharacterized damage-inducible protein DinB
MKSLLRLVPLAVCCLAATAAAQSAASPVSDAIRSSEQRSAKNLIAAAEEMPADKYSFKPTPAQMSVGEIVSHLNEGNDFLCSKISGATAPKRTELPKTASKDQLIARLKETFQFCETTLAKVNDSDLGAKVQLFGGREFTRAQTMFITSDDWADHYSQLAIYLRLNGLLPPTAKKAQS